MNTIGVAVIVGGMALLFSGLIFLLRDDLRRIGPVAGRCAQDRQARGRQGGSSLRLLWTGFLCQGEPLGAEIVGCALDPSAHDGPVSEAIGTANGHPCERLSALSFALAAH
jgi:hypothetical protein